MGSPGSSAVGLVLDSLRHHGVPLAPELLACAGLRDKRIEFAERVSEASDETPADFIVRLPNYEAEPGATAPVTQLDMCFLSKIICPKGNTLCKESVKICILNPRESQGGGVDDSSTGDAHQPLPACCQLKCPIGKPETIVVTFPTQQLKSPERDEFWYTP